MEEELERGVPPSLSVVTAVCSVSAGWPVSSTSLSLSPSSMENYRWALYTLHMHNNVQVNRVYLDTGNVLMHCNCVFVKISL